MAESKPRKVGHRKKKRQHPVARRVGFAGVVAASFLAGGGFAPSADFSQGQSFVHVGGVASAKQEIEPAVARFDPCTPITFHVDTGEHPAFAQYAFDAVDKVSDLTWIQFERVSDPQQADITMSVVPKSEVENGGVAAGAATTETRPIAGTDRSEIMSADIRISDALGPKTGTAVFAHEIGHALGLSHSRTEGDLMSTIMTSREVSDMDRAMFASVSAQQGCLNQPGRAARDNS